MMYQEPSKSPWGKVLNQNIKSLRANFMPTLGMNYSYQYQSLYNEDWNILDYNWSGHPHCWACVLLMGGYVP